MRFGSVLSVVLVSFLTACSSLEPVPPMDASASDDSWHARGRFSYRSDDTTESGNFDWRQVGNSYQVRLYGPLGMGTVRISGNRDLVRIQAGDQDISSDQPLSLMYNMTGLEIPLNSLPHWLLGNPASSSARNLRAHPDETRAGFTEYGWQLSYPGYQQSETGRTVPEELHASKNSVQLRLLIHSFDAL
ncbi:MAG: lipoprotein insertase outer membrane protein LolB [Porticoccaceae bacterium]